MKGVNSAAMQAEQLKLDGNLCFMKNRFGAAIDAYTEVFFQDFMSCEVGFVS